jgi:hypothetical protein
MPGKTNKPVTVNFSSSSVSCVPDPVVVNNSQNLGIQWTANQIGYTFTGVQIDGHDAPYEDFGSPLISTNPAGRSVMTVSDDFADYNDHTYCVLYTTPEGQSGSFDPTIENRN